MARTTGKETRGTLSLQLHSRGQYGLPVLRVVFSCSYRRKPDKQGWTIFVSASIGVAVSLHIVYIYGLCFLTDFLSTEPQQDPLNFRSHCIRFPCVA